MLFRQILHEDLGCASYVIADGGEAVVVDPKWEIEDYLRLADEHGFRITRILETHDHADHVSGRARLAEVTGASAERDAVGVEVGDAWIVALSTPGHRPEHTAFLVYERSRSDHDPWLVLTGDSLFVDDLARPDLAVDPDEGARGLFESVRKLLELSDWVEVWPGHIGGSLCGGSGMSKKPSSTIGFERRNNRFLRIADEAEFVQVLTESIAPQPPNFERIVDLNRRGPPSQAAMLDALAPERVNELIEAGAVLLDGREVREWDAMHVPSSLCITTTESAVGTRAAWVVDPETPVVVTAAGGEEALRMARLLEAVGFQNLRGYLAGGVAAWREAGLPVGAIPALDPSGLAERLLAGDVELLDVREDDEWEEGHVEGSLHVPYHELPQQLTQRNGKPLAIACSAGNRSAIAASLLLRAGVEDVQHVAPGGVPDLEREGIPLVAAAQAR
jgi:hydroxyacylglutathione hydrolase